MNPIKAELTPEERAIITTLENSKGRELTEQEIALALDQARAIGDIGPIYLARK
jgi:hypothetical protein